ncbi:DUF3761 domain-containing protein [Edaphobacter sp. DSM 109919]|uniref:DUF3761 domain-containing protein n=1 Tax=Edaphobacter paludis TaxID=3035702 RepID=A0AAU7CW81_9BACT
MKICTRLLTVAAALLAVNVALAQAPPGATGQCKDGTYTTAPSKQGACRGHKGVQTWLAAESAPAAASKPAAAPMAPMNAPAKSSKPSTSSMQQAAGGGPGMVWVNTSTKVYHCPGTKYYGKTKEGKYMSEADAKASGARADHGTACSK